MPPISAQMAAQQRAAQLDRANLQNQRAIQNGAPAGQANAAQAIALRDHIDVLKALGLRNQQIAQHPLVATHPLIAHHLADRFDRQTSRTTGQGQAPMREPTQPGPPRVLPRMPGYTPTPGPRLPPPGPAPMAPRPGAYRPTPGLRSQPPATASWLRPRFTGY